jgi:hypothetical protein
LTIPITTAAWPFLSDVARLNPFNWSTSAYLIAIAAALILHRLVQRDDRWYLRLGREMLLITPAVFLYFAVRGMVDAHERESEAIRNAEHLISFQKMLGIYHELTIQSWILESDTLVTLMNWIYIWGHWPVVVGTLIWLIIWRPNTFQGYRNAFLLSGVVAMFVFALYPMAPPRLMPDLAFVDTITQQSQSYRVLQPPALTNPFAAMPSLHLGWNLLMGIAIVRESRPHVARMFGYVMPVGMFLAIVLTGNHYFLDGVAGGMLVIGSLWVVMAVSGREYAISDTVTRRPISRRTPRQIPAPVTLSWGGGTSREHSPDTDDYPHPPGSLSEQSAETRQPRGRPLVRRADLARAGNGKTRRVRETAEKS